VYSNNERMREAHHWIRRAKISLENHGFGAAADEDD
jgi:hypothetical protein